MTLFSLAHDWQAWLIPPGLNILLIFLGIMIWFTAPRTGKILALTGLVTLWVLSTPFIAYPLINILQNKYPEQQLESIANKQSVDAIVVIGAGGSVEERNGPYTVSDLTLQRLEYAAYLRQKTHLPIIVSGDKTRGSVNSEADIMAKYLLDNHNIIVLFKDDKTQSSDERSLLVNTFKQKHIDSIYLVTHAFDMSRSQFIFECSGIKITPVPMGYIKWTETRLNNILPDWEALNASAIAMYEFLALRWYHWKYGNKCG